MGGNLKSKVNPGDLLLNQDTWSLCLPFLVLPKARHLGDSAFCNFYRLGGPEQALGGIPLGFGIVVEDKPSELS